MTTHNKEAPKKEIDKEKKKEVKTSTTKDLLLSNLRNRDLSASLQSYTGGLKGKKEPILHDDWSRQPSSSQSVSFNEEDSDDDNELPWVLGDAKKLKNTKEVKKLAISSSTRKSASPSIDLGSDIPKRSEQETGDQDEEGADSDSEDDFQDLAKKKVTKLREDSDEDSDDEIHEASPAMPIRNDVYSDIETYDRKESKINTNLTESQAKTIIEEIKNAIGGSNPKSAGTQDEKNKYIVQISALLKSIQSKETSYLDGLKEIAYLANAAYRSEQQNKLFPAADAWFLWRHSSIERIAFHYLSKPTAEGQYYLSLAQAASERANALISRGGSTDISMNIRPVTEYSRMVADISKIATDRDAILKEIAVHKEEASAIFRLGITLNAAIEVRLAKERKIGNCGEKAYVALEFLKVPAELFYIGNGDHAIVVIGRKPNSNPKDYTTWGPDAVVCDPWAKKCYFAREIPEQLNNLFRVTEGERRINQLESFHPHHHYLGSRMDTVALKTADEYLKRLEKAGKIKPINKLSSSTTEQGQKSPSHSPSSLYHSLGKTDTLPPPQIQPELSKTFSYTPSTPS